MEKGASLDSCTSVLLEICKETQWVLSHWKGAEFRTVSAGIFSSLLDLLIYPMNVVQKFNYSY